MTSKEFEIFTMLRPISVIESIKIQLPDSTLQKLKNKKKVKNLSFKKILLEGVNCELITAKPRCFECLIIHQGFAKEFPELPAGAKEPDEFYVHPQKRVIIIIEKKSQISTGSVDEKIQTAPVKKYLLSQKFEAGWKIHYVYCLSNHFRNSTVVINFLEQFDTPVFWGLEEDYHQKMINFINQILLS